MMMIFPLYQTNAIILIFIVLHVVHYNNSPRVDMSLYSESHTSSLSLAHQCCSLGITYPQSFSYSLVLFTRDHIPPVFLLLISAVRSESHTPSLSLAHQCCFLGIKYLQSFSCSLVLHGWWRSSKYQISSLLFDPTGTRTQNLPHTRRNC